MSTFNTTNAITPPRINALNTTLSPIHKKIILQQNQKKSRQSLFWGAVNISIVAVIIYDLISSCSFKISYIHYLEYALLTIFSINTLYHFLIYLKCSGCLDKKEAKKKVEEAPPCSDNDTSNYVYQNIVTNSFSKTPMDMSAASWLSNTSHNTSCNMSMTSPSWSFHSGTPQQQQQQNSPNFKSSPLMTSNLNNMEVDNEESLTQYLKEYEALETSQNLSMTEKSTNLLSFFWNHPGTKMNKDASPLLGRCQYQLSTASSASNSPKSDDKGSPLNISNQGLDTWRRLNVDSVALTQWNENLRIWLSQTILCRLINEFDSIDKSLHNQGLNDISIGAVGLDRLRKTAQGPVLQNTPNLPAIVQFLELHSNQEYLVKRIRELAKGGCMSQYKWNGGSNYNGKEWDLSLPTDAAIIMHLTASYLDTQLLPLPNKPDIKPFTGFHYIKANEKLPELTQKTLAIHEVSINPPHYRVIIGLETYEMVKGYNNLFHSILLFLYHVNQREHGMLGRVNLGRSGVNMLWIIQSN